MLSEILPHWTALMTIPVGVLVLFGLLAIVISEIRYARHDSIEARMRRFAALERQGRGTPGGSGAAPRQELPGGYPDSAPNDRSHHS